MPASHNSVLRGSWTKDQSKPVASAIPGSNPGAGAFYSRKKEMEKNNYWISFSTELISLYSILRTTLKRNSKTKAAYEELKVLEKYQLEIGKLSYSEGIRLYNIIEGALYDIGVLNIELEKEDVNQSMR